jgi:hypothetical protein
MANFNIKSVRRVIGLATITRVTGLVMVTCLLAACTKYGKGFLSPNVEYAENVFTVIQGRTSESYSLTTDGSSVPMTVAWTHIYDSAGNVVDSIFKKTYPVAVWTAAYDPLTDTTYAAVIAKQGVQNLQPLVVNGANGTIEANAGTYFLPLGTYSMDLQVTNGAGSELLKKIVQIQIVYGEPLETTPEQGNFSNGLLIANTASSAKTLFNGTDNPFDSVVITRVADTPNRLVLKITDKNGVPFDPSAGEIAKRPNSGLDPDPPFLQNLQDYAPDTYLTTDTAISILYPLVPFPIASLGNGYNMYYRIPSQFVTIDSTSAWSSNTSGGYYLGTADPHYLGVYTNGIYDPSIRIPMRIQVPGSYEMAIKILDLTHR